MKRGKPDDGLRALVHRNLPQFHWQSVETGAISSGVPDSNYCFQGVEGWVEMKATDGWAVTLRPEQIGWIARRVRAGGRVHVMVRRRHSGGARRGPPVDELWVIHIRHDEDIRYLKLGGLRHAEKMATTLVLTGGPARWLWGSVAVALLTTYN
jgi:hypothetical protein